MLIIRTIYFAIIAAVLLGVLPIRPAWSEEALRSEAESYLKENSNQDADSRWERDFHLRANEAMRDNQSITDEERYADDKALEFFFDRKKHFDDTTADPLSPKDKIEIARWYLLFFNNGWRFPSRIAAQLTKSNYERYVASR